MSYDITLKDPVTNETCEVPAHLLTGGNYLADYDPKTDTFSPKPNTEAWLNITYNYAKYFYDAMKAVTGKEQGIRELDGHEAAEFIPIIKNMIDYLRDKYSDPVDGNENVRKWKTRIEKKLIYYDENGNKMDEADHFKYIMNKGDIDKLKTEEIEEEISEGDTYDYWEVTAANAIRSLYKLKALFQLRPDGIISVG